MTEKKSLYLSKIQMKAELERCLNCKTRPCMSACPVNCNPQEFINFAKQGNFSEAVETITRTNPMGQTCGLICPDKFCMKACTRSKIDFAVNIPKVQATILENYREKKEEKKNVSPNGKSIAVIGAGPAGMAAAAGLSSKGYAITAFEASDTIGGALNMIPDERLPHEVIEKDWSFIADANTITFKPNTKIDNPLDLLKEGFNGVIVATGEPHCVKLNIPGEDLCLPYMEYLRQPEKYQTTGKVAVIGGGNVAADCAFTAQISGAEQVEMFVRRRLPDMRISNLECLELLNRQVNIYPMSSPEKVEQENGLLSLIIHKNHFVDGKLTPLPNSSIKLPGFSLIITAIGSRADEKIDDERIIYAGDCKNGGSTIVEAIASGQSAALLLDKWLSSAN